MDKRFKIFEREIFNEHELTLKLLLRSDIVIEKRYYVSDKVSKDRWESSDAFETLNQAKKSFEFHKKRITEELKDRSITYYKELIKDLRAINWTIKDLEKELVIEEL